MIKLIRLYIYFLLQKSFIKIQKISTIFLLPLKTRSSSKKFSISPAKKELNLFAPPTQLQPCFSLEIKNYRNKNHSSSWKLFTKIQKISFTFPLSLPPPQKNSTFLHYQRNPPCFSKNKKITIIVQCFVRVRLT